MKEPIYPRARLEALGDAIFGVAMTLLVLDVRLPEEFHPQDADGFMRGIIGLGPKFWPYALSFLVLGLRWLATIQVRSRTESFNREYAMWWLLHMLLITCVPFTTIVVGRFAQFAPAIWLYAGNTLLIGAVAYRLLMLTDVEPGEHLRDRSAGLLVLMGSSLLAIGWSFINPRQAPWAFVLNALGPLVTRWTGRST